jgi:glycosyltransferase involved in cell wall biosynthesis
MQPSNLDPIKVIYDISVLGQGHLHSRARTGVFRVVENIAEGLAKSPECDLSFCVTQYFQLVDAALDYLETNPKLKDIALLHSSFTRILYRKLIEAYNLLAVQQQVNDIANTTDDKLFLPEVKSHLEGALNTISNYWNSIDPDSLDAVDIFHSPYDEIPASVKLGNKTQNFLTVYDLIPILYPQFILGDRVAFLQQKNLTSLSEKDCVICISQSTKNDLCNYLKIDESRVFVTHLAAEPTIFYPCNDATKIAATRNKYQIPEGRYILSLSTLEPRKNLDGAIRSFGKLIQEQKIKDLYLVLVGTPGWKYEKIMEEVAQQTLLQDRIIFTGYVPESDLAALYSGALAFVYPSFYEGFGLPPLEAMQCGIPVITSNNSALPEVVGEAGIMLNPKDTDGLCDSMLQIYNQPSLRATMSLKSLAQAKKFSWERCTQETLAAYRAALS